MTTTTPTTSTGTSAATTAAQAASTAGSQELAGNFDTFLQLLTTQLQNQDPLNPLDTNQFTQQLVEFASVEQQINTNSNLQTMISLQQVSEATSAMQLLGANVTISSATAALSSGAPATWNFSVPSPATGTVTITNSAGETAYTGTVSLNAGNQSYTWNGTGTNGVTWPAGNYTLSINATGANGQAVTVSTQVQGVVSGVNVTQSPPQVTVGGESYPISSIQSLNNGGSSGIASSTSSAISNLNTSIGSLNTTISNLIQSL